MGVPSHYACWQEAPGKRLGLVLFWAWTREEDSGSLGPGPLGHSHCPGLPTPWKELQVLMGTETGTFISGKGARI